MSSAPRGGAPPPARRARARCSRAAAPPRLLGREHDALGAEARRLARVQRPARVKEAARQRPRRALVERRAAVRRAQREQPGQEALEVVVLQPRAHAHRRRHPHLAEVLAADKEQARRRRAAHQVGEAAERGAVHPQRPRLRAAALQPPLEQRLVERIRAGAEADGAARWARRARPHPRRVQPAPRRDPPQRADRAVGDVGEARLAKRGGEGGKLELRRAELGERHRLAKVGLRAAARAAREVHRAPRHAARRLEGAVELAAGARGEREQLGVARQRVRAEQPADHADAQLEEGHLDVALEARREVVEQPAPRALVRRVQPHQQHRVERVDHRHREAAPVVPRRVRERPQLVLSPRVRLVRREGVGEGVAHEVGAGTPVSTGAGLRIGADGQIGRTAVVGPEGEALASGADGHLVCLPRRRG